MKPILPMDGADDTGAVGGKAAALCALVRLGFDVPAFFVLTDAAFGGPDGTVVAQALHADINRNLEKLGPGPYAVRSSAKREDSAADSHAGQFETLLNVAVEDIATAAAKVRGSGVQGPVAVYRRMRGIDTVDLPAVLVQRMVPARAAGVAFTADPVSGRRDRTVIAAVSGLADALVSGDVDGEDWVLDAKGAIDAQPSKPEVLSAKDAREIAALARRAEAAFGAAQDIEWAFDGDGLLILQSRAITTALRPTPMPDDALIVLDNSNIIESYPGLVSPLTYSFAIYSYDRVYRAFVRLLGLSPRKISANASIFANLLTRYRGRVYYNLGNWYRALALLPGFSLNAGFMETMMGVDTPLPAELTDKLRPTTPTGIAKIGAYAAMGRVALGLLFQAAQLPRTRAKFMARLERALSSGPDPKTANLTELAESYRQIEAALLDRWDAPLVNDFLCMIGFGASRKLLMAWGGDESGAAFHNDIMIGQGDIISAEPAQRIAQMAELARGTSAVEALASGQDALAEHPRLRAEIESYLAQFGDRCTEELKLESTPLTEDPTPLFAAIRAGALREISAQGPRPEPDWTGLIENPVRRFIARQFCAWASARVRDRENLRFERTRIFGQARRVFRAMGRELHAHGRLNDPKDVFELTVAELLGAVEGAGLTEDLMAKVALRKTEAAQFGPEPPRRLLVRGQIVQSTPQSNSPVTGDRRVGTGCSAGRVTAPARVIHDPRTEALEPGDILVARNTDPGWIAVFANASGIIVERGSLLSHSAIVARELGIPCAVGIADATDWVQSGDMLTLDGATGEVSKSD
ncbi:MAG: PEP/pyruvate-binding domain-containing protein [Pseudomonadota bacterium]